MFANDMCDLHFGVLMLAFFSKIFKVALPDSVPEGAPSLTAAEFPRTKSHNNHSLYLKMVKYIRC